MLHFINIIFGILLLVLFGLFVASFVVFRKMNIIAVQSFIMMLPFIAVLVIHNTNSEIKWLDTEEGQELFTTEIRGIISDDKIHIDVPKLENKVGTLPIQIGEETYNVKYAITNNEVEISQINSGTKIYYDLDSRYMWENK